MDILAMLQKLIVRIRTAVMNPFRKFVKKAQLLFNTNTIVTKVVAPINKKVRDLLNIKPKSKEDYYSVGIFWISKKLVYFTILAACAAIFLYFTKFAEPVEDTVEAANIISTIYFDYDDLKLAEFSGRANIKAANGNVVYSGDIAAGVCTGTGTLWNQNGSLIYEGQFEENAFSGTGTLYYPSEKVRYQGEFSNNVYSGSGISYYQDGRTEYEGTFENGAYFGTGSLYNEDGILIYSGNFENGNPSGAGIAFYENGTKKYEGEFYVGKAQGLGTSYSPTGRKLFTGQFARDQIQYESLLNLTMEEILTMCNETPKVYYAGKTTCFLFEGLNVVLETNCIVNVKKKDSDTNNGNSWYLPGDDLEQELLLESADDTVAVDYPSGLKSGDENSDGTDTEEKTENTTENTTEAEKDKVNLPVIDTAGKYTVSYYLDSGVWQDESELDYSKIQVTSVSVFNPDFNVDFLADVSPDYYNGEADLLECVAIDQLRLKQPTLFSYITFAQSAKTNKYIQISGINLAEAIYAEEYSVDNVKYRLCYDVRDSSEEPESWQFITLKPY